LEERNTAIRKWHQWLLKAGEEHNMPQGKGTYGNQVGRPPKKKKKKKKK